MGAPEIRAFRLSPRGRGISCDSEGVFVGSTPLLKRSSVGERTVWELRETGELSDDLSATYGLPIDIAPRQTGLRALARSLNGGRFAHAQTLTLFLQLPEPPLPPNDALSESALVKLIVELRRSGLLKVWEPDRHPRWPAGAPDSQGGQFAPESADLNSQIAFYESSTRLGNSVEIAATTPRIKTSTIIRRWEKAEGKTRPLDPKTGRNRIAAHIKARADGGSDEPSNIKPMPADEHIREHKERGDFGRWARLREKLPSGGPSENASISSSGDSSGGSSPQTSTPKAPARSAGPRAMARNPQSAPGAKSEPEPPLEEPIEPELEEPTFEEPIIIPE